MKWLRQIFGKGNRDGSGGPTSGSLVPGSGSVAESYGYSVSDPILCWKPSGERAVLDRLRCPNGHPFNHHRLGSYEGVCPRAEEHDGPKPIDKHRLKCTGGEYESELCLCMYHRDAPEFKTAPKGLRMADESEIPECLTEAIQTMASGDEVQSLRALERLRAFPAKAVCDRIVPIICNRDNPRGLRAAFVTLLPMVGYEVFEVWELLAAIRASDRDEVVRGAADKASIRAMTLLVERNPERLAEFKARLHSELRAG